MADLFFPKFPINKTGETELCIFDFNPELEFLTSASMP